jgi:2-oxo-4-hydroxy-4-carboxy--5-ureidoimidazoline (OHCU) decarboxylase
MVGDLSNQDFKNMFVDQLAAVFKKGNWEAVAAIVADNAEKIGELEQRLAELEGKYEAHS